MQNKFKITDESGDRKYFTIIPNYIVNHSTPYEQAIYLFMKRKAGESGTCWSSAQEIGKHLGVSRNTVAKYRNKLVKRGWIVPVGKRGKTKPTDEYKIVDLWSLNTDFYSKKESSRGEQSPKKVQEVNLESASGGHKEDPTNKEPKSISTEATSASGKEINEMIDLFKKVNPSYEQLFKRKNQHEALARLSKKHGKDKIIWAINILPKTNAMQYAPTITTPIQLEDKLGSLIAFIKKEQGKAEERASRVVKV